MKGRSSTVKKSVYRILQLLPECRDDDKKLFKALIDIIEGNNKLDSGEVLSNLIDGKYGSPETVRRYRQKFQELYPELRGKKWLKRHARDPTFKLTLRW